MAARKLRRLWIWGITAAVLAGLAAVCLHLFVDEGPPADGDLRLEWVEVPESENGFHAADLREEEIEIAEEERDAILPFWVDWDRKVVDEVLRKNREALERYDRCLQLPHFQMPGLLDLDTRMPYLPAWRAVTELAAARIGALFEDGKEEEAFREAVNLLRFGSRIAGAQGNLIAHLMSFAIKSIAARHLHRMIEKTGLAGEKLKSCLESLLAVPVRDDSGWSYTFKAEYRMLCRALDALRRGEEVAEMRPEWYLRIFLKPNQTKRLLAEAYRRVLDGRDTTGLKAINPRWPPGNWVGKILFLHVVPDSEQLWTKRRHVEFLMTVSQILLGLKCYKDARGKLPDSLAELVPEYLPAVPADPFDGQPIRYSAARKYIYSVGKDGVDAGGIEPDEEEPFNPDEPTQKFDM